MNVFIGGSRTITRLPPSVLERIDNIIAGNFTILIGDANGADRCVQQYLAEQQYRNVLIFCSGGSCRNNLGHWETRHIAANTPSKGFAFYVAKDLQMAKEAAYGFMLWDGRSKGTLNNLLNLLQAEKKVVVYFAPGQSFHTLRSAIDLQTLLDQCGPADATLLRKTLPLQSYLGNVGSPHGEKTTLSAVQLNFHMAEARVDAG